jgi:hypothetical protein
MTSRAKLPIRRLESPLEGEPVRAAENQVIADAQPLVPYFALKPCQIAYGKPCRMDHVYGNHTEGVFRPC